VIRAATAVMALALGASVAGAQGLALRLDQVVKGNFGANGEKVSYSFSVDQPGALTIVGSSAADLQLSILDDEGQLVPSGFIDRDYQDELGEEFGLVVLSARGSYTLEVKAAESQGPVEFTLTTRFLGNAMFFRPDDPDGKPSGAATLQVGAAREETLSPNAGDKIDWFAFTANVDGTYVVATRAEMADRVDLQLEVYGAKASFNEPETRNDQDLRGNLANESVTIEAKAGDRVRVRVVALNERGDELKYRVSVALIP
jgi:hypothetical protein